ncbi:hypothetical protein L9F63_022842, partial [Diploptera punctata]
EWSIYPLIPFKPVVETEKDAFLPTTPQILAKNLKTAVPFMTGITSGEGAMVAAKFYADHLVPELDKKFEKLGPMTLFLNSTSPQTPEMNKDIKKFYFGDEHITDSSVSRVVDLYTDSWFLQGANQAIKLLLGKGSPVYYYYFAYRGSRSLSEIFDDTVRDYGVCHADELLYLFPRITFFPGEEPSEEDEEIIDIMITLWTNFAKFGDPTPTPVEGKKWPNVTNPEDLEYLQIDKDGLHVKQGLRKESTKFWDLLSQLSHSVSSEKDEL